MPQTRARRFVPGTAKPASDLVSVLQRLQDFEAAVAMFIEPARKKEIGERLRRARENSPFTQRDLADAANVTIRGYQHWEEGRSTSNTGIALVAKKLGVPFSQIWEGDPVAPAGHVDRVETAVRQLTKEFRAHRDYVRGMNTDETQNFVGQRIIERLARIERNQDEMMAIGDAVLELLQMLVPDEQALAAEQLLRQLHVAREQARDSGEDGGEQSTTG